MNLVTKTKIITKLTKQQKGNKTYGKFFVWFYCQIHFI